MKPSFNRLADVNFLAGYQNSSTQVNTESCNMKFSSQGATLIFNCNFVDNLSCHIFNSGLGYVLSNLFDKASITYRTIWYRVAYSWQWNIVYL